MSMKQLTPICFYIFFFLWQSVATADYITRENFGKKSQFDTSSSSSSYQSTWGWEGWNPNSSSASSSSSSGSGGSFGNGNSSTPAQPVYNPKKEAKKHYKLAKNYFDAGDWENAQTEAYKSLKASEFYGPKAVYIWARSMDNQHLEWDRQGVEYLTMSWKSQVKERYEMVIHQDPNHKEAIQALKTLNESMAEDKRIYEESDPVVQGDKAYNQGSKFMREEKYEEAVAAFRRAIKWNYNDHEAHARLGFVLSKLDRDSEAIEAYKEAIYYESKDPIVFENLSTLYRQNKNYSEAINIAKQVIEMDPYNASYHNLAGEAAYLMPDYEQAERFYNQAVVFDNQNSKYLTNLAITLHQKEDYKRAIYYAKEALEADPDNWLAESWLELSKEKLEQHNEPEKSTEEMLEEQVQDTQPQYEMLVVPQKEEEKKVYETQAQRNETLIVNPVPSPNLNSSKASSVIESNEEGVNQKPKKEMNWQERWDQTQKDFKSWMEEASKEQTINRIPGVAWTRAKAAEAKKNYEAIKESITNLFNFGMKGVEEGNKRNADPKDAGEYEESHNRRIQGEGQRIQEEAEGIAKDSMGSKI